MGDVIGDFLPLAIGIALSPFPIIGLILILFTKRARTNSLVFVIGWLLGLAVVAAIVIALFNAGKIAAGSESAEKGGSVVNLLLGLVLLYLAYRNWKSRPKEGEVAETPKWMTTIDSIKPGAAFGLGFLLSGVNPKNLLLNVAGALAIAQAPLTSTQTIVAVVLYILIASVTIIGPVVYYQVAGANAEKVLNEMKGWLIQNNTAVMAVLLLVFGVKNVGEFIGAVL